MSQQPQIPALSADVTKSDAGADLLQFASLATREGIERAIRAGIATSDRVRMLLSEPEPIRIESGYGHTLREVFQQPSVWADTALRAVEYLREQFLPLLEARAFRSIVFAGSGSSHYVGELVAPMLTQRLGMPVSAVAAGDFLTHGRDALPHLEPSLVVSIARSGNSPESLAAVRVLMREAPDCRFLHITCNGEGKLVSESIDDPRVQRLILHPFSNDQSLVMTSSFTSMALAGLSLGFADSPETYLSQAEVLAEMVSAKLPAMMDFAASLPFAHCRRALYLGSGCQVGASREAALKLTEMTAGRILSTTETYLGLRHGPMAAIDDGTLIVCSVPPDPRPSRYAADLIRELQNKELGLAIVVAEPGAIPRILEQGGPEASSILPHESVLSEPFAAIANVVIGQAIGFFACREGGLRPDAPSESAVITRVVEPFPIYEDAATTALFQ